MNVTVNPLMMRQEHTWVSVGRSQEIEVQFPVAYTEEWRKSFSICKIHNM